MTTDTSSTMNHALTLTQTGERLPFLIKLLAGKSVLHVGCADVPVFDPDNNLHIQLSSHIEDLAGLDIDIEGIDVLRQHVDTPYFTSFDEVDRHFDVVLVPEVLEHIPNPGLFLGELMKLDTDDIVIMTPNAIDTILNNLEHFGWTTDQPPLYIETTHSDHKCYYSPVTLAASVRSAMDTHGEGRWMLNHLFLCSLSACCILKRVEQNAAGSGSTGTDQQPPR